MEGPSLFLAQEQLRPFKKKWVLSVSGNSTIDKERFQNQIVKDIFSWGKHLLFQFEGFALRVHFLLFGTFSAIVEGESVTGDYTKSRVPRLAFTFENGSIEMYNCSVKIIEDARIRLTYNFKVDIMSKYWDPKGAFARVQTHPEEQIADALLDQEIFGGVGNIIKNEVLSLAYVHPMEKVHNIPPMKLREIIDLTRSFSLQFYRWRKKYVLRKNLRIHGRGECPHCGGKVMHEKTGRRNRISHYCPVCQVLTA